MKAREAITVILGAAAIYWVVVDLFIKEETCTLSTVVSETETIHQVLSGDECKLIKKDGV